jgi:predicted RNA-binding protein with EMAP domain
MFVGAGEGVMKNVDGEIGTAPRLEADALQEVRNQVMRVLRE